MDDTFYQPFKSFKTATRLAINMHQGLVWNHIAHNEEGQSKEKNTDS